VVVAALLSLSWFMVRGLDEVEAGEEQLLDRVVAVVGDKPITLHDVRRVMSEPELKSVVLGLPPTIPVKRDDAWALNTAIDNELILSIARNLGTESSDDQVNQHMERFKNQNKWSQEEFVRVMIDLGFYSFEDAKRAHKRQFSMGHTIRIKVGSRIQVTQKQVGERFRRLYGQGKEEEVYIHQILIRVPLIVNPTVEWDLYQHIQKVRDQLVAKDLTFAEAAQKFSDGPNAQEGGDIGWARKGTFQFDHAAFDLEKNAISPVIRTYLGFHILKVTEGRRVDIDSPDRLKRVITQQLWERRFPTALKDWEKEIRNESSVRIMDWKPLFGANARTP